MVPLYWIWTSTTTSIIKEFFVSENQYIGKLTIFTTFFYYLCNANDSTYSFVESFLTICAIDVAD